ncbi:MAG: hypothetical protein IM600_11555 [Bacteroidetes bacterium]|nr:hypothetical protein [Bacteroidota bacterium]
MKKLIPLILVSTSMSVLLINCKSSKSTTASIDKQVPTEKEVEVYKKINNNITLADLQAGHKIYYSKCNTCHQNFEIVSFSEKKWRHEIDDMSPKAELNAEEKNKLTLYILSYLAANKTQ